MFRRLAIGQGGYYVSTGVWSLLGIGTFQWVTGRKTDIWLVKTVGLLVAAIGATLLVSSTRPQPKMEAFTLGAGSAAAPGAVETFYAARRRISPIYAIDGLVQFAIVAGWIGLLKRSEPARPTRPTRLAVPRLRQIGRVSERSEISS
jgi:hypothetical protein